MGQKLKIFGRIYFGTNYDNQGNGGISEAA
jgi:hypothetical protein